MLDVRRLRLLRELAHRGTIAAVAEALTFTPSAVSQQLSVLEQEAGLPLLERSGRRVVLTPAAWSLVERTEAVLEQLELASAELARARGGPAGPVRIGTYPTAGRTLVPGALRLLAQRYPDLEPRITELDPARAAALLRAGELDVALVHAYDFVPGRSEPGLAAVGLCRESMWVASSESVGEDAGLEAWASSPWITALPGTMCEAMTLRACEAAGFTPRVRHQVDDFGTMLALVEAGQGVAMIPQLALADGMFDVVLTHIPIGRRTLLTFRDGSAAHPAVTAVTDALRDALPAELAPLP